MRGKEVRKMFVKLNQHLITMDTKLRVTEMIDLVGELFPDETGNLSFAISQRVHLSVVLHQFLHVH